MAIEINNKVILLTEKEIFHFHVFRRPSGFSWKLFFRLLINVRLLIINKLIEKGIKKAKCRGKKIICHFGNNFNFVNNIGPEIDFVLAPKKYCSARNFIPFTSRDFVSSQFKKMAIKASPKLHFAMVSNISHNKRQLEVFNLIAHKIEKNQYFGTAVFVAPKHSFENKKSHQLDIIDKYVSSTNKIKNLVTLARASEELGFNGFTGPLIPMILSETKYLVLASRTEGEPRVINEAIEAGSKVLYTSELKFSKPEIMNANNSIEFKDIDKLVQYLCSDSNKITSDEPIEVHTKLTNALKDRGIETTLVAELNDYFSRNEGLDRILPSHSIKKEKWFVGRSGYPNNEIKSIIKAIRFLQAQ